MIIASAIKLKDGRVFVGKRHGSCLRFMKDNGLERENAIGCIQGFITDRLVFLNREEAYYEALSCDQCEVKEYPEEKSPILISEDLW